MENQNLMLLAQKVSKNEATIELAAYWQKRYELILENNLFVLSEKTSQQITNDQLIDRPSTPFGDLVLLNHLDANNQLDDIRLQATIETAVRFLDAALDALNFNEESRFIVNQYRKIGLGIYDIAEFLETKRKDSELDIIDHLGNLISNSSYRASETLAEEKKPCNNWSQISKHLRPKSFELWHRENQDVKTNGLALSEQYDAENILETDYEIIPRRNSNLLLLPAELEWQLWSDRDESSPKTTVTPFVPAPPVIDLGTDAINLEPEPMTEDSQPVEPEMIENMDESTVNKEDLDTSVKPFLDSISKDIPVSETTEPTSEDEAVISSISQPENEIDMSIFETLPEEELQGNNLLSSDIKSALETQEMEQLETSPIMPLEEESNEITDEEEEEDVKISDQEEAETDVTPELVYEPISISEEEVQPEIELLQTQTPELLETHAEPLMIEDLPEDEEMETEQLELEVAFAVGELVKITRKDDSHAGKIYQILDRLEAQESEPSRYRLIGGSQDISNILWTETDLELVDLDALLDEINLVVDNDKSLENNLVDNLELELIEAENKIMDLQNEISSLQNNQPQEHPQIESSNSEINPEKIIDDYLASDDFAQIIETRVSQKIQDLNLVPKTNHPSKAQNQTISTLQMMRKYQSK